MTLVPFLCVAIVSWTLLSVIHLLYQSECWLAASPLFPFAYLTFLLLPSASYFTYSTISSTKLLNLLNYFTYYPTTLLSQSLFSQSLFSQSYSAIFTVTSSRTRLNGKLFHLSQSLSLCTFHYAPFSVQRSAISSFNLSRFNYFIFQLFHLELISHSSYFPYSVSFQLLRG